MKKLILILSFTVSAIVCISQPTIPRASASNTPTDIHLFTGRSFRPPVAFDTTVLNSFVTLDSCGKIAYTYKDNSLWLRKCNPKRWELVGSSASLLFGRTDTRNATVAEVLFSAAQQNFYIDSVDQYGVFSYQPGGIENRIEIAAQSSNLRWQNGVSESHVNVGAGIDMLSGGVQIVLGEDTIHLVHNNSSSILNGNRLQMRDVVSGAIADYTGTIDTLNALFGRTDTRNETGAAMNFSAAGQNFTIDSVNLSAISRGGQIALVSTNGTDQTSFANSPTSLALNGGDASNSTTLEVRSDSVRISSDPQAFPSSTGLGTNYMLLGRSRTGGLIELPSTFGRFGVEDNAQSNGYRNFAQNGNSFRISGSGQFSIGDSLPSVVPARLTVTNTGLSGNLADFGRKPFGASATTQGKFNVTVADTVTSQAGLRTAGSYFRREIAVNSSTNITFDDKYGTVNDLDYYTKDTITMSNLGADLNNALANNFVFRKYTGFSGRSRISSGSPALGFDAANVTLNRLQLAGSSSGNGFHLYGFWAGNNAYILGNPSFDSVEYWAAHIATGGGSLAPHIVRGYNYFGGVMSAAVDSGWTIYGVGPLFNSFLEGSLQLGLNSTLPSRYLTQTPDPSLKLEVNSTTKGVLFSRMTGAQMTAISAPTNGTLVYNTDSSDYVSYKNGTWRIVGNSGGSGVGSSTWNAITDPTGDQALTFGAGESSTWTNSNTTENLFTANTSTLTSANQIRLVSTSTALAAGNSQISVDVSGANGTNAITAAGISASVTNTNATSGTNVAYEATASGATTANLAFRANAGLIAGTGSAGGATPIFTEKSDLNTGFGILTGNIDHAYITAAGVARMSINTTNTNVDANYIYGFNSTAGGAFGGGIDMGIARNATGVLEINNGTKGTYRDLKLRNIEATGNIGVGIALASQTARLHIAASTTSAGSGQIKFEEGSTPTTPENGLLNYVSNNLQFTETSTNYILAKTLTATASLDFTNTLAQTSNDLTITVTGAATGDPVSLAIPHSEAVSGSCFTAWVSSSNTVTVRFNNYSASPIDLSNASFTVSVIHY